MIDDTRVVRIWIMAAILSAVILANISCGGSSNNPGPSPCDPAFGITAGDGQTGEVSTQLPDTLKVQATECDPANPQGPQLPEAGVAIAWAVTGGGGTVNGSATDTVTTDANGIARAVWVLGSTAGTQTVSATAVNHTPAVVNFSALANPPATGCPAGSAQHSGIINSDETWGPGGHVLTGNVSVAGSANLTIEAGAHVCMEGGGIEVTEQSHLFVRGAPGNPVIIEGGAGGGSINFGVNIFALTTASTISNARFENAGVGVFGGFHPVVIESTLVRDGGVSLNGPNSAFRFSTIVRGRLIVTSFAGGPIDVEATVRDASTEGILVNGTNVTFTGCEVTGCGTAGIISAGDATTISLHGSNLFGNGDVGLSNGDLGTFDATGNWWGDPAGPNGPNGDGVSGNVNAGGALSAPAILGYRPPE